MSFFSDCPMETENVTTISEMENRSIVQLFIIITTQEKVVHSPEICN